jgi:peptidyl-prolyl cis-trans isomerase SurA
MKLTVWIFVLFAFVSPCSLAQNASGGDYIVALINSEPLTNAELQQQMQQVAEQRAQQGMAPVPEAQLRAAVIQRVVNDRTQLQLAREMGIRADSVSVDQAETNIAAQNQTDVLQFRQSLEKRGISVAAFRQQLRDQIVLSRLHEREVEAKIKVSDAEVEAALEVRIAAAADPANQEVNLGHLLLALPDNPSADALAKAQALAQTISDRLKKGDSFEALVKEFSSAERSKSGQLGMRRSDRYPPLFIQATQALPEGGVSAWVRSDAGLHLLRVLERRNLAMADKIPQTRARHILLRPDAVLSPVQAQARLAELRGRILGGKVTFEAAARDVSQDGSAADGGELGWASPGMFVPEFEDAMNRLAPGEISAPLASRFGVHLIQVLERRSTDMTPAQLRERERDALRGRRYDENFVIWERDVRDKAFVEMREAR